MAPCKSVYITSTSTSSERVVLTGQLAQVHCPWGQVQLFDDEQSHLVMVKAVWCISCFGGNEMKIVIEGRDSRYCILV